MSHNHNQRSYARLRVGLTLTLIGLMSGVALMSGPARNASAQAVGPSWSNTGNLNTARSFHTATLLTSGKVLVAGGFNINVDGELKSAELYDPATGVWSGTGNLNTRRDAHTATLLPNGKVLVAGGIKFNTLDGDLNAELYDPATGTWSITGNFTFEVIGHTATLLPNGKVLVAGGLVGGPAGSCTDDGCFGTNTAQLYDPDTGTWSSTGNLNKGRFLHTATLLTSGKVLVAGGFDVNESLDSAELYDPATGIWSSTVNLNTARDGHTATLLPNGKVLVAAGNFNSNRLNSAEVYDPPAGVWSSTGNLNAARGHTNNSSVFVMARSHTATLLPGGKVLVAGGEGDGGVLNSAELYDSDTGSWTITAGLNAARANHTATQLTTGKTLIVGGSTADLFDPVLDTAELYDPGPNQIDDPQFLVRQHYLDFLNRQPDADGLAFWTNEITLCGADQSCIEAKRINVSGAFFVSIEFQETGYLVYRIYKSSYGNLPGTPVPVRFNEFLPDTQLIGQGVIVNQAGWEQVLENNKQTLTAEFVQRSRFTSAYSTSMTPEQFVDQLFMNAGVTPSPTDRAAAISEFGSSTTTTDTAARARALRRVAENSTLAQQEFNRAFVLMQYFGYLRRNPPDPPEPTLDYQGYDFWLNKLNNHNGNFRDAEMVEAFLVSGEYRQRFGP